MALPDVRDIGRRRKAAGLTQKELALRAGVSQSIVAKIESGSVQPSYEIVRRLFAVFDDLGRAAEAVAAAGEAAKTAPAPVQPPIVTPATLRRQQGIKRRGWVKNF